MTGRAMRYSVTLTGVVAAAAPSIPAISEDRRPATGGIESARWSPRSTSCLLVLVPQAGEGGRTSVNLGIELEREVSPATYLWEHRREFRDVGNCEAALSAIQAGMALEGWRLGEARRAWRVVVEAAREEGRRARREGHVPRRLATDVDRVREVVELVLFDGRLPSDLAALAARCASKMCARSVEHALAGYWQDAEDASP